MRKTRSIPTGTPTEQTIDGSRVWVWDDGTTRPLLHGGADEPAPASEPAGEPAGAGGETVTIPKADLEALKSRLDAVEKRGKGGEERPPSTREQIETELAEMLGIRKEGVTQKNEARDVADQADALAKKLAGDLRSRDLRDAATSAKFRDPALAAKLMGLEDVDGSTTPSDLAAKIAAAHPDLVAKTTEPDFVGGNQQGEQDAGLMELARSIQGGRR